MARRIDLQFSLIAALQEMLEGKDIPLRFDDGELTGATEKCRQATIDALMPGSPVLVDMPLGQSFTLRLTKTYRTK